MTLISDFTSTYRRINCILSGPLVTTAWCILGFLWRRRPPNKEVTVNTSILSKHSVTADKKWSTSLVVWQR
jgi:hypothetical protein